MNNYVLDFISELENYYGSKYNEKAKEYLYSKVQDFSIESLYNLRNLLYDYYTYTFSKPPDWATVLKLIKHHELDIQYTNVEQIEYQDNFELSDDEIKENRKKLAEALKDVIKTKTLQVN